MFPVLFTIGPIRVETYYVLWSLALCLMVVWTRKRAVDRYGISFSDATDILLYTLFGVFIGATVGGYFDNWSRFADSPLRILHFWESGLSSGPGFLGGGLLGLYKIRKLSVSVNSFAEAASVPTSFMLFVGRWGCFFNGCCHGLPNDGACAVVFPSHPGQTILPTQLFESFAALAIGVLLLFLERKRERTLERGESGVLLWPLFLILYGSYRSVFDFLRAGDRIFGLRVGQYMGMLALLVGLGWLFYSKKMTETTKKDKRA